MMPKRLISFLCCGLSSAAFATLLPPNPNNPNAPGTDNFGSLVQQNTNQALQVFQNMNYTTLTNSQGQNYFFGSEDTSSLEDLKTLFKLAPEN